MGRIIEGDNLAVLATLESASVDLVYIDPPFNTGRRQTRTRLRTVRDDAGGDRTGFQGQRYRTEAVGRSGYEDRFEDFPAFIAPRLAEGRRVLKPTGSFFLHMDYREVHYAKVLMDAVFGRECFQNEIIWAYDYGARSKRRWPAKHDNILWYVMDPDAYTFNYAAMDRIPYLSPGMVGPEKAARGKTPTDVWWQTIVSTNGREKTGYATQKPIAIVERIVKVHTNPGDVCLDYFAGSGTLAEAAARHGRDFIAVDDNPAAIDVMAARLAPYEPTIVRR